MALQWFSTLFGIGNDIREHEIGSDVTLIYYCSIVTIMSNHVIAEYSNGDKQLARNALECIKLLPPHHDRYSFTANTKMFACIVDKSICYCAVADEALTRSKVMSFLEDVRQEFSSYAKTRKLLEDKHKHKLQTLRLNRAFKPIFRKLISPLVGIPQRDKFRLEVKQQIQRNQAEEAADENFDETEVPEQLQPHWDPEIGYPNEISDTLSSSESPAGSRSPSSPLINKENRFFRQPKTTSQFQTRDIPCFSANENVMNQPLPAVQYAVQQKELTPNTWCTKKVKIILVVDAIICMILLIIWLSICKGIECIR